MFDSTVMLGAPLNAAVASFAFPGVGQGLASYRRRMVLWAIAVLATMLLITVSVWMVPVTLLLRIAGAFDAHRCMKRHAPPYKRVNAAIAIVIGAVGFGSARAAVEGFKIPSSSMYPTLIIGDHIFVDKLSRYWRDVERGDVVVFTHPCSQLTYVKRVIARGGDTVEVRCSVVYVNGNAVPKQLLAAEASYLDRDDAADRFTRRMTSRFRETLDGRSYDTFYAPASAQPPTPNERGDFPRREWMFAPACSHGDYYDRAPGADQPAGRIVQTKDATADACEPQLHFAIPDGALFMMGDNRDNANDSRYWGLVRESAVIGRAIGIWMSTGPEGSWSRFGAIE